jgi:transcriptional regulator with XRE-family HTH domain
MDVNQRIKQVRNAIGLSQAKFAKRMAISSSYLAEIELNKKEATERVIRLLAVEFNVNDNWIRTGEGEMFKSEMDAQIATVISLFNSLSQNFKSCAVNQMQELATLNSSINIAR